MFIAHLPASYLLGKAGAKLNKIDAAAIVLWTSIGGVLPDIDMFYFYLIDSQSTHHRSYITHWPVTWVIVIITSLLLIRFHRRLSIALLGLGFGSMLHMVLDSIAAPVLWMAPFSQMKIELITIPAVYENYIWSFVLHWTFAFEVIICIVAAVVFWKSRTPQR
ncbi:inner membrane protein [Pseudovibrio sp. Tun.PSC04-5.I4]|nr:inner membrane protein [Pseudovibrio sp. Tun.PSC04-5.I4]